ncbi:MAG: hypothetical protein H7252_05960 [Cytophaga sp.]|nr:hypothetical protein [Undibacterium sp.]
MLISPPFLPNKQENQTDENWLDVAMPGGRPGDGFFPLSFDLGWHGGMHLTAPLNGNVSHRVRAIADGTVVFKRAPIAREDDIKHPQNYRGRWTDNGCIVIRHDTEIGEGQNAVAVSFFSIYMHLSELHPSVKNGRRIYRKDDLGQAGQIYGDINRKIHFEIVCDDANLRKLTGRISGDVNMAQNGRADAVYGEMYFVLPIGTQIFSELPLPQLVGAHVQPPKPHRTAPLPSLVALAAKHNTTEALVIGMRHAAGTGVLERRGDTYFSTYKLDGSNVGRELREPSGEYQLYATATSISKAFPATSQPAPSAVYELLRFGRVINTAHETLTPADVPHWRQVNYPGGTGWVNLNVAAVTKFSDADFPHWRGWKFIDDSQDLDSHCDSTTIKNWLDISGNGKVDPIEAAVALNDPAVMAKLEKTICKFPSEWQISTIDKRWSWLKIQSEENPVPITDEDFTELKAHITALCFSLQALDTALWHWHPIQFIKHFRTCGWLSLNELAQLLPRKHGPNSATLSTIPWTTSNARFTDYQLDLNRTFRKYCITSYTRQTHFLAQTYIETALWQTMRELGKARQQKKKITGALYWPVVTMQYYGAFYGRGIMQLTWASNYESYGKYRKFSDVAETHIYKDNRMSMTSTHYWSDPRSHGVVVGIPKKWARGFDPDDIAADSFKACDSGAHYWVSKSIGNSESNINRVCDRGVTHEAVGRTSVLVNGGGYGFAERQSYAAYINRFFGDTIEASTSASFSVVHGNNTHVVYVDFTPQRP